MRATRPGEHDGTCAGFAALDEDGSFVGLALAPAIDDAKGEIELGYVVAPAARGRGVAGEMLRQLTAWALAEAGAQRIVLIIDVENAASSRVAERAGYTREGVMRSHLHHARVSGGTPSCGRGFPAIRDAAASAAAETSGQLHRDDLVRPVRARARVALDLERVAVVLERRSRAAPTRTARRRADAREPRAPCAS